MVAVDERDGEVVPFRRRGEVQDAAPPARGEHLLHQRTRRAEPGARRLAAEQAGPQREAYAGAAMDQANERLIATGRVVPARITLAMNLRGAEGPDVDVACGTFEGNPAGDVDDWELGVAVPTREQVRLIAVFTDFPEVWFYRPMKPGPLVGNAAGEPGFIFLCGPRGCTIVKSDWVDENGVLHYGDGDEPRAKADHVQVSLPILAGEPVEKAPPSRENTPAPRKKAPAPAVQPTLPTRMPEHLRAGLEAKGVLRTRP